MLFNRTSILNKMLVAFFAIILGLTTILGFSSYWIAARTVEREITANNLTTLSYVSDKIDLLTEEIMSLADLTYLNKDIQDVLKTTDEVERIKSEYMFKESLSKYRFMFKSMKYRMNMYSLADSYHYSVGSSELVLGASLSSEELKAQPWVNDLVNKKSRMLWLSDKNVMRSAPQSSFSLARPLNDLTTFNTIGILVMSINTDILNNLYSDGLSLDSPIMIMSEAGELISSSNDNVVINPIELSALYKRIQGEMSGHFIDTWSDRKALMLFLHNKRTGWYIVQSVPLPLLLQFQQNIKIWIFLMSILCTSLALLLAFLLSRRIYKPIQKLKDSMKIAETGNLSVPALDIARHDEIGILNRGFVRMIEEIRLLLDRLVDEERKKRQLELFALHSQINHHFLYNTLSTIRGTIYLGKTESANEMIISLVKLLKRTWNAKEEWITIEDEIENLQHYVLIQTHRFQQFHVTFEVEEGMKQIKILKLMIQPLIENAIFHGIKSREGVNGSVFVRFLAKDQLIQIEVADNGVGIAESIRSRILSEHNMGTGIGVRNVHERIQLHYGRSYGVTIWSEEGLGTTITLTLPAILNTMSEERSG